MANQREVAGFTRGNLCNGGLRDFGGDGEEDGLALLVFVGWRFVVVVDHGASSILR